MPHSLPARLRLALLLLLALLVRPALATHLLGGEMTYRYLDSNGSTAAPLHYEITVTIYNNSLQGAAQPNTDAPVGIYDLATGTRINLVQGVNVLAGAGALVSGGFMDITNYTISGVLAPSVPLGCAVSGPAQPFRLQKFTAQVYLPVTLSGFYAVFTRGARNTDITNLNTSGNNSPLSLYATLAPPLRPNRSPVFSDTAVAIVCQNDTTISLNNAVDADGDRLVYSFGSPFGTFANPTGGFALPATFPPLPNTIAYNNGYSMASPFGTGAGNFAILNASTGVARYGARQQGKYVVAVDVQEYRTINGREVLIGTTRRDLQLIVATCPSTVAPALPVAASLPRTYTIEEGQSLTINLSATQVAGNPLVMTVNSALLDGAGGINATFNGNAGTVAPGSLTGTATAAGSGTVGGAFIFNSACGQARANPYDIAVTVQDKGCGGKTIADVFRVTVVKPTGPTAVAGDLTICSVPTTRTYSASGGTAPGVSWRVVGGTIVGSRTANPVQVSWTAASGGTLVARGVSQYGCLTDSVTQTITVTPPPALTVSGNLTICQGTSTTIAVSGAGTGAVYTVTGGPVTGSGASFVLTPTQTTTYTITAPVAANGCPNSTQVTVTVNPAAAANVGAATRTTCSGTTITLGAAAVTGSTYSWSPATGLSSPTVANPTVTLTNTTGAPITQTYALTETTSAGCSATNSVTVTVNPAIVAVPGPAVTICSGASAQLGAVPVAGLTYSWSPSTGLSSSTVANPTVTLTNTTSAATTTTYTLTTTDPATSCSGTATVAVTVNPAVVAVPGPAVAFCSGSSATLGAAPVAGYTYQWSPSTGLSSSTVANPTVTLTNPVNTTTTYTYTLTVTSTATGCSNTASVVVTVNRLPVAVPGAAVTICSGGSATLGAVPDVGGMTYSWSPSTGLNSPTSPTPTVTLTNTTGAPITQTYTLTVTTTSTGCTSSGTVVVTVNPLPTVVPGPAATICSGASTQLGGPAVTGLTYNWSPATGLSSTTVANPTVTLTNTTSAATTQTYTLTTTNTATGCVNTGTVVVTVNPAAVANAGAAQTLCADQTVTLGTPALAGYTYQWTPAANLSSATAAQPVLTGVNTTAAPLVLSYSVLATTAQGCTATSTVQITVNPRPATDSIAGAQSVCPTITGIAYSIRNPHSTSYQWTVTGGAIASGQGTAAITVNWGAAGTGSVSAYATNAQGCNSNVYALPVRINQLLQTVKPSGPTSVCQADGPYAYSTPAVNGSSFAWQLFGTAAGTLVNTGNTTSISFSSAGLAKLVVTQTSNPAGGVCRGVSDTLYITVKPSPSTALAIQGPARFCFNSGAQTYTLPGAAGSTYVFQLNGTTVANTNGTVTIPATTAVGNYTLTARETNSGGCAGILYSKTFIVDPRPGVITINGPRFVCPATRTLTYTVPNATSTSTYQWTVTNGTIASGQGTATITVSFPATLTTNATVSVTETSQFGCGGAAVSATVVPDNAQAPQLTLASVVATDNTKVTLTFSVANPANTPGQVQVLRREANSTGAYATVGTVAPGATSFVDATPNAAQTAYQYTLSLTNGCGDVLPAPTPHTTTLLKAVAVPGAPNTPRSQGGSSLSWTAYQGFTVASYQVYQQLDNGGYTLLTTVGGSTLTYNVPNTGQGFAQCYRVVAVSGDAQPRLANSNTACVEFTNGLAFYNVITPNNDGQNDKLEILNVQLYPGNTMEIYNRWGRQVYSTTNYNNDSNYWGTDPGIAPGVYYYLFKQANGNATKGWVEVVK